MSGSSLSLSPWAHAFLRLISSNDSYLSACINLYIFKEPIKIFVTIESILKPFNFI